MSVDVKNQPEEAGQERSGAAAGHEAGTADTRRETRAKVAERDATIEQLERAIADEREHSASLRQAAEELKFKMDILERSYSKQLEDARLQTEAAEQRADDQGARVAELDGARNDAIELLTEAKAELDRLNAERNQLRKQLASRDGREVEGADDSVDFDDGEGTINALMNDAKWMSKAESEHQRQIRERKRSETVEEAPTEDMIAPELVLTSKSSGN